MNRNQRRKLAQQKQFFESLNPEGQEAMKNLMLSFFGGSDAQKDEAPEPEDPKPEEPNPQSSFDIPNFPTFGGDLFKDPRMHLKQLKMYMPWGPMVMEEVEDLDAPVGSIEMTVVAFPEEK